MLHPSLWCQRAILLKGKFPEWCFRSYMQLDKFHIFLNKCLRGGIAVGVTKNGLKMEYELCEIRVLYSTATCSKGPINQFAREMTLDSREGKNSLEEWFHDGGKL